MSARVQRVIVGVDGSQGSLAALRQAAREAARHGAELCPVMAWSPPGGEARYAVHPAAPHQHRQWEQDARRRLSAACDTALGDIDAEVRVSSRVVRAGAGPTLVACSSRDTDMLVVGVGGHGMLHRLTHGSARRHCLKHSRCPVLVVHSEPTSGNAAAGVSRTPLPGESAHAPAPATPSVVPLSPIDTLAGIHHT
ncbi:universal stress protein [Streptomyces sp. cg36]|uniref:universal stress protein n=1 Tax=Streptomyces sp. cg36 TaxID=3238798 RepID=UPI0034E1FB91